MCPRSLRACSVSASEDRSRTPVQRDESSLLTLNPGLGHHGLLRGIASMRTFLGSSRLLRALPFVMLAVILGMFGLTAARSSAATSPQLNLKVLLIGGGARGPG